LAPPPPPPPPPPPGFLTEDVPDHQVIRPKMRQGKVGIAHAKLEQVC